MLLKRAKEKVGGLYPGDCSGWRFKEENRPQMDILFGKCGSFFIKFG